jgi:hypothetical protein
MNESLCFTTIIIIIIIIIIIVIIIIIIIIVISPCGSSPTLVHTKIKINETTKKL